MRIAKCQNCNRAGLWVNLVTLGGKEMGELCAECFEAVPHDSPRRGQRGAGPVGPSDDTDPMFDNLIRAIEGD